MTVPYDIWERLMTHKKTFKFAASCALAAAVFQTHNTALATNGTWGVNASGTWSATANWSSGIVANSTDAIANFSGVNITADRTVTLDTARTVGSLTFGDTTASNNWILTDGGTTANVLTFADNSAFATVTTSTANATISLVMTGNVSFQKAGADSLTISKAATYLGSTTISAGTLILGINNAVPDLQFVATTGTTFNMNGHNQSITDLNGTGIVTSATAATLTINGNSDISSANDSIQGAIALTVANGAIVDLGGINTYTGTTTITSGAILDTIDNGIPIAGTLVISSGQLFELNNHNQTLASFNGGTIDNNQTSLVNLTLNNASTLTTSTKITGKLSLVKNGAGQLVLDTASTYTGGTTITSASTITSGITNALPITTSLNLANTFAIFDLNNNNQQVAAITGAGTITNSPAGGATLTVNNAISDSTFDSLTGSLSLDKQGVGLLTLGVAVNYTGTTTVDNGTLAIGVNNALPIAGSITVNSPGIFDLNGHDQTFASTFGAGTITNSSLTPSTLTLNVALLAFDSSVYAGNLSLNKTGAGIASFKNNSTYTGSTTVTQGFLDIGIANALPTTTSLIVNSSATCDLQGFNQTVSSITGAGTISSSLTSATLTVNTAAPVSSSNILSGQLALDKQGLSTLTLNVAASYAGTTTVETGTLISGITNALPTTTTLSISSGAFFDLNGNNQQVAGLAGTGTIENTSATPATLITSFSGNTTITNLITQNLNVTFLQGNVTLTTANTYSGSTLMSNGNVTSQINNALPATTALSINSVCTFDLDGNNQTLASLTGLGTVTNSTIFLDTLTINNSTPDSSSNNITGTLNFTKTGSASFTLNTAATYALSTTIASASTLADGIDNAFPVATFLTISNAGGIFDLNNHNQQFFSIAGPGTITNSGANTSTLTINTFAFLTPTTVLTGNLNFDLQGTGVVNFAVPSSYTGNTTIDGGTLRLNVDNALPATALFINSPGNFDLNGKSQTISSLTGTGLFTNSSATTGTLTINSPSFDGSSVGLVGNWNLTKLGNSVLLQAGGATYTGLTTITGGGIQFQGSTSIGQLTGPGELFIDSTDFTSDGISVADVSITVNSLANIRTNGTPSGTSKMNSLLLQGSSGAWTSGLNINNNHLIIEDTANHANTLNTLQNQVAFGRTNNDGIFSLTIPSNKTLVISDNAIAHLTNFGGINNVDAGSILITVAFKGDFNLDGVVDILDLTTVANHWQQSVIDWSQGDFDGNNTVDILDLTAVANNWQAGVGAGGGSSFNDALAQIGGFKPAVTPEPASFLLFALVTPTLLRRSTRRPHRPGRSQ